MKLNLLVLLVVLSANSISAQPIFEGIIDSILTTSKIGLGILESVCMGFIDGIGTTVNGIINAFDVTDKLELGQSTIAEDVIESIEKAKTGTKEAITGAEKAIEEGITEAKEAIEGTEKAIEEAITGAKEAATEAKEAITGTKDAIAGTEEVKTEAEDSTGSASVPAQDE